MDCNFRSQRSTRACMKQTLQMMLLLLVCAWLLYQINQSRRANRTERFGGEITIIEEFGIVLLGRKVIPSSSWSKQIPIPNSGEANFAAESENDRTDEAKLRSGSDQKVQEDHEKDETERFYSFHDENGVPPEVNDDETGPCGNGSGFSSRKEIRTRHGGMNTHETVIFSGDFHDDDDDEGN
ncbi:uncharacterized protein LOC114737351 [Neltuma alba]|uniref:uncharacterized protein LOC114737351 n=1 Tax=Neltuma alba TaxID=207710 RepID=UPI0010A2DFEB|nr:uncharacterized protein LOC114737351 [Prosopis alba]